MCQYDLQQGRKVLVGDDNWRKASLWTSIRVLLWGKLETFEHLGMQCHVRWWRGAPYLTSISEAS